MILSKIYKMANPDKNGNDWFFGSLNTGAVIKIFATGKSSQKGLQEFIVHLDNSEESRQKRQDPQSESRHAPQTNPQQDQDLKMDKPSRQELDWYAGYVFKFGKYKGQNAQAINAIDIQSYASFLEKSAREKPDDPRYAKANQQNRKEISRLSQVALYAEVNNLIQSDSREFTPNNEMQESTQGAPWPDDEMPF